MANDIIAAPLNDHSPAENTDKNTLINVSANATSADNKIKLTATDLPAHYNGGYILGYWIGFGFKKEDSKTYEYDWGRGTWNNDFKNRGVTWENYTKDSAKYDNFYFGVSDPSATTGYFVVSSDNKIITNCTIDFSGVKLQKPEVKLVSTDVSVDLGKTAAVKLEAKLTKSNDYAAATALTYTYKWYSADDASKTKSKDIGATGQTYTIPKTGVKSGDKKYYFCVAVPSIGKVEGESDVATVKFTGTPPSSGSDTGGGSGGGTGTDTGTETTTTDQAAEQLVENMDETVANSDAGKAMTEALQSDSQETKEAAVDVVSTLNDTLSTEEIAQLTTEEIQSAVQNKAQETQDAAAEDANGGVVTDTTKPAGTDLIAKSDTASEALKTANENLSVQPKVVTPTAATPAETEATAQNLANVNESNLNDKDVDLNTVQAASENLKSAEDIEIDNADNDVALQAQKVEAVFDEVSENLAKAPNAGGGSGVVIASVLSRMRPTSTGFFQIKINLRNLTPGRKLKFWPSVAYFNAYVESRVNNSNSAQKASLADVSLASSEGDAFFLDADGNPVTKVAGNAADMSVVPYLEGGKDYTTAFITADATESDKAALEALASSQETTTESGSTSSSSSGGCELGLGLGALAAFMAFMKTSKKR